jgi:hypothetical protein
LGVNLERVALKRVNLVTNKTSDFHGDASGGAGRKAWREGVVDSKKAKRHNASSQVEPLCRPG